MEEIKNVNKVVNNILENFLSLKGRVCTGAGPVHFTGAGLQYGHASALHVVAFLASPGLVMKHVYRFISNTISGLNEDIQSGWWVERPHDHFKI
jgi:hypothetical protein